MAYLGELGLRDVVAADAAEAAERDSFDWFGESFTIADRLSALHLMKMAWDSRRADGVRARAGMARKQGRPDEAAELEGAADRDEMASMWEFLQTTLAPGEWDRFVEVTSLAGADDEALTVLIQTVIGVISGRPTSRPSASAGGPSTNLSGSPVRSSGLSDHDRQAAELFFAASPA